MSARQRLLRLRWSTILRERQLERQAALLAGAQTRLAEAQATLRRSHEVVRQCERAVGALTASVSSGPVEPALLEACLARIDQLRDRLARALEALSADERAEAAAKAAAQEAAHAWASARARLEAVRRWRAKELLTLAAVRERAAEQSSEPGRGAPWI